MFHYYLGPSKFEDLGYLTVENLFHVQLADLAQLPRELATDADRILPGDGDFLLEPIVGTCADRLCRAGGGGADESAHLADSAPGSSARWRMTALRKTLGLASMG